MAFVHFPGRLARLDEARAGTAPTEFLFGAIELERAGHDVRHYEVDPAEPVGRLAARAIDRQAGVGRFPPHLSAAALRGTRRLLPVLRGADVVVATTTGTTMALATWRRAGLLRRPLVGIVAGLLNRPWGNLRRRTTLSLLRTAHPVLYGPGERDGLLAHDPGLAARLHVNPFAVDTSFWSPGGTRGDAVVAIGNDGHRDWPTLVRAAGAIDAPVRILTGHRPPDTLPANVSWEEADWHRRVLSDVEVRELFHSAAVVVVPVKDVPQPSGQSVTLQASACGRPVVLTRTRGLWDDQLRDGEQVSFVAPGDGDALAHAVNVLLADPDRAEALGRGARTHVAATATVEAYAERLLAICRDAAARSRRS
jgi:glycosyltransferase involved in cell wall biosynthesis